MAGFNSLIGPMTSSVFHWFLSGSTVPRKKNTVDHDNGNKSRSTGGGGGQGLETGRRKQNSMNTPVAPAQVCVARFFLPRDTAAPDIVHEPSPKKTNKSN